MVWLAGSLTVGEGLRVMVNVVEAPLHVPITGVTVMVAISWLVTRAEMKFKSPVPLAANPMAVLLFVQENVAPEVPENTAPIVVPAQA